jgi:predicted phosphodiesterase
LRDDMARTQSCDDTLLVIDGDMITGDIHDELRETNDGGLRAQADACLKFLYRGVQAMRAATPGTLHVVCIGGNHGRLTKKQHIKNGTQHSVEHIGVYDPLRRLVGEEGVAWHIPPAERHIMTVHGRRVSTQHGTMIRSQGGIGGTLVPMTRWVTRANDADLYLFGHFHEADAYGKIVKNGSLIGSSGYVAWLGIEDRGPEQVAFVLDADRGVRRFERVSCT